MLDLTAPGSKTRRGRVQDDGKVTPTLDTGCEIGVVEQIGNIVDDSEIGFKNPQRGRIYDPKGIAPSLNTVGGGRTRSKDYDEEYPNTKTNTQRVLSSARVS